ncbi:LANO_0D06084g1_1 [Lachancea nothofagi CBS 11611]|uniref:LANO_0D06084g1_1 n=1 Tax=Lachancea nothofagi CBS 11611 TaxID=1266666 RepID=A0A1G4JHB6_9SACH|nr:LANO_0D06084g1_1 [Lachancea nothofagi CBS 11611]
MVKKTTKANKGASNETTATAFRFPDSIYNLNSKTRNYEFVPTPESMMDDKIIIVNKFFSNQVCQEICASLSQPGVMELFEQKGTKEYAERLNERFATNDAAVAQLLWEKLYKCIAKNEHILHNLKFINAKGLNPQIRAYRYEKGHRFAKHYDSSIVVPKMGSTHWTLLLYLSGGDQLVGGDTIFYSSQQTDVTAVHPQVGMALLHKHGDDCLLHEAQEVYRGVKWVLRSDVVFA